MYTSAIKKDINRINNQKAMLDVFRGTLKDRRCMVRNFLKVQHGKSIVSRGGGGEDILPRSCLSDTESELAKYQLTATRESKSESRLKDRQMRENYVSKY